MLRHKTCSNYVKYCRLKINFVAKLPFYEYIRRWMDHPVSDHFFLFYVSVSHTKIETKNIDMVSLKLFPMRCDQIEAKSSLVVAIFCCSFLFWNNFTKMFQYQMTRYLFCYLALKNHIYSLFVKVYNWDHFTTLITFIGQLLWWQFTWQL